MKKRKPHNPLKRYQRQSEAALSGLCFGMKPTDDSGYVIAYRVKDGKEQAVGPNIAKALDSCCFKYAFCLVVTSTESNGKIRTVSHFERLSSAYRHSALINHLNDLHDTMLDSERDKGNAITGAGWLACPVPYSDDDLLFEQMLKILEA